MSKKTSGVMKVRAGDVHRGDMMHVEGIALTVKTVTHHNRFPLQYMTFTFEESYAMDITVGQDWKVEIYRP